MDPAAVKSPADSDNLSPEISGRSSYFENLTPQGSSSKLLNRDSRHASSTLPVDLSTLPQKPFRKVLTMPVLIVLIN
jgi:hypothetical protein